MNRLAVTLVFCLMIGSIAFAQDLKKPVSVVFDVLQVNRQFVFSGTCPSGADQPPTFEFKKRNITDIIASLVEIDDSKTDWSPLEIGFLKANSKELFLKVLNNDQKISQKLEKVITSKFSPQNIVRVYGKVSIASVPQGADLPPMLILYLVKIEKIE